MTANVWGIHGGKTGDADTLFLKHSCIGLGWPTLGDLTKISPDREAFKDAVAKGYPDKKPGAIPNNAGQLYRFVHSMKLGDLVVYPSKRDRQIHIGRISGEYRFDPKSEQAYPNLRAVTWLKALPRSQFPQGALYEIGSAMSLFRVKNYAEVFTAAAEGTSPAAKVEDPEDAPEQADPTVRIVAEQIEELTRVFVLREIERELKGHPFAELVADLLRAMGLRCRVSPPGPDGGIDIVAHKDELGFEPPIIKVQVKSTSGNVGDPAVSALFGKLTEGEFGLIVALGSFTPQAIRFADTKSNLRLIDGDELVDLLLAHYEQLEARFKGLLPLKRVYVPEPLEEADD